IYIFELNLSRGPKKIFEKYFFLAFLSRILKPVNPAELLHKVKSYIEKQSLNKENSINIGNRLIDEIKKAGGNKVVA
ncbi:MAG: hypothetical protein V2A57_03195, partial [Elusimicrobiota bacterium]